jgi:co-chaperonin GroES (HSP10)
MSVRPLRGHVLVRLLPHEYDGLIFHDSTLREPEEKATPRRGIVVSVGAWRKTKDGFSILPDFKPGSRVLINEYLGKSLSRSVGENYRLCEINDVLALLTTDLDGVP